MKSIEILISPEGAITIEAKGYAGPECAAATQAIADALGHIVERKKKPEYYQRTQATTPLRLNKL
jgi:hypothetical protein